jgi:hypothetical protein
MIPSIADIVNRIAVPADRLSGAEANKFSGPQVKKYFFNSSTAKERVAFERNNARLKQEAANR